MSWNRCGPTTDAFESLSDRCRSWRPKTTEPITGSTKPDPTRRRFDLSGRAVPRDECLSPRVRLECNPEIPVAPGEEHWLLDTSLDEVYWPCSHSRAIPSFPSQL